MGEKLVSQSYCSTILELSLGFLIHLFFNASRNSLNPNRKEITLHELVVEGTSCPGGQNEDSGKGLAENKARVGNQGNPYKRVVC